MFDFARDQGSPLARVVQGAPDAMRMQLVAAIYRAAEEPVFDGRRINVATELYPKISLLLGVRPVAVMHDAYAQRIGRDLEGVPWPMVFEVVLALWEDFRRHGRAEAYRAAINGVFALHGIAWDLDANGRLQRVLPGAAEPQVTAMFAELSRPEFHAARDLANAAQRHFNARPREPRDAVSNMFDAMESAAKVRLGGNLQTFGDVCNALRAGKRLSDGMVLALEGLNTTRNRNFGHGNVGAFTMSDAEVDFVYLACVAGTLLFARME